MTLLALWVVGTAGVILYANQKNIPAAVWGAVLPALLLEASMYIAMGFPAVVDRLKRLKGMLIPAGMLSALIPYLFFSLATHTFRWEWLGAILVLSGTALVWYRVAPRDLIFDLLFLFLMAGVFISAIFPTIYVNPAGKPSLDIVGRLMWTRMGLLAILLVRGMENVDFGFIPGKKHWLVGVCYFLAAIVPVAIVGIGLGFMKWRPSPFSGKTALMAMGTFLGILWVTALMEEFVFRGLLQQWMHKLTGSFLAGLVIASCFFGMAHLWTRGFPNWRFALVATVAGLFYGLAYQRSRSIRASMVTHALMVTAWRVFFV